MINKHSALPAALVAAFTLAGISACGEQALDNTAHAQTKEAPVFEVDPFWPKPLPNHWVLGATIGLSVDSRDHVFIVHRRDSFNERTEIGAATDPKTGECCIPAPNILEFDPAGNLVNHWGGPGEGYTWPSSNHGVTVDHMDNIWIGGNGATDSHILKFTRDGEFLKQFGEAGQAANSLSAAHFAGVAEIAFDANANEAYVADGYRNKRVAVLDADKEGFLRSDRSLIQTIGRAARNLNGRAILYADRMTGSMQRALAETSRRREVQIAYNLEHGITPRGIAKAITDIMEGAREAPVAPRGTGRGGKGKARGSVGAGLGPAATPEQIGREIRRLEAAMLKHARELEFEDAAACRDALEQLRARLLELA